MGKCFALSDQSPPTTPKVVKVNSLHILHTTLSDRKKTPDNSLVNLALLHYTIIARPFLVCSKVPD